MAKPGLIRYLATSEDGLPRFVRGVRRGLLRFSLPAPRLIVRPAMFVFVALRTVCHHLKRVMICEPLFKAYCHKVGRRLRTGCHIHWIQGRGRIEVGDDVWIDGKSSFSFARRFVDAPLLSIGDGSGIGHACTFVVGKRIVIGKRCIISGHDLILGSNGHPAAVTARQAAAPPAEEDVRDVIIGDDVWIGRNVIIFPGVKIGQGSIVSAGSVVRTHVPPRAVVAGNPAKVMFRLPVPGE